MLFAEPPKDLIRKLLVVDPKKRITVNEALQHPFFHMMVRVITCIAVLCSCSSPVSSHILSWSDRFHSCCCVPDGWRPPLTLSLSL